VKVIVGLGNPGKQYENTPHNIGFDVVEELASRHGASFRRSLRFSAWVSRVNMSVADKSAAVLLVKPRTYMNNSGMAVAAVMRYHKLGLEDVVVVLDDADLDIGSVRIRQKGGSGGHNGLKSVASLLGSDGFTRVRLGIGHDEHGDDLVDHVLGRFSASDRKTMDKVVGKAADAVRCVLAMGEEQAMNEYNGNVVGD
jgi:PTH1 family peptidyl-tRNA hydrolase